MYKIVLDNKLTLAPVADNVQVREELKSDSRPGTFVERFLLTVYQRVLDLGCGTGAWAM